MKNNAIDLLASNSEVLFDSLLENGLLKDLPFIGSVINILRIKGDITNYLFAKKLETFLLHVNKKGIESIDAIEIDKDKIQKIGKDLVFILERSSNIEKSKWVAEAVIGLTEGKYNFDTFERLIYTIERFSPTLKSTLDIWYKPSDINDHKARAFSFDGDHPEELANLGLLRREHKFKKVHQGISLTVEHVTCNLGAQLWNIIEDSKN